MIRAQSPTKGLTMARILVACEESQAITLAFRAAGHEAFSCDIQECSGGRPEWHIRGDALSVAYSGEWDLMIGHPPCTYLSRAGARWLYPIPGGSPDPERLAKLQEGARFFRALWDAPIERICLENVITLKLAALPPHSQTVHPYEHGHPFSKATRLWLKNLPPLEPTNVVAEYVPFLPTTGKAKGNAKGYSGAPRSSRDRSKTFEGIARAMAEQWGPLLP